MRYDSKEDRIYISVSELVATARRGISDSRVRDEDEPSLQPEGRGEIFTQSFCDEGVNFLLYAPIKATDCSLTHVFLRESHGKKPSKEESSQARGEAYLLAKLLFDSKRVIADEIKAQIIYKPLYSGDELSEYEYIDEDKASRFFSRCVSGLKKKARAEIERVTERLPTMKSAIFPYEEIREGQREFIRSAYRTIAKGGELFSEAPTGTGKTVSVLFPAIRALGDGRCEKVFYFTPKTTTAKAAADCLTLFEERGVNIRSVILISKERLCSKGTLCKRDKDLCDSSFGRRLIEATFALFDKRLTVVDTAEIKRTAADFGVCPHELSLSYSELCDVIICDFNYLFDPQVYIRRFFSKRGEYAFLVDEAHNLVDRAREMYSAQLNPDTLSQIEGAELLGEHSPLRLCAKEARIKLDALLYPLIKDEIRYGSDGKPYAAHHMKNLPSELYPIIGELLFTAENQLQKEFCAKDNESKARLGIIRDFLTEIRKFNMAMSRYDGGFETFLFLSGEKITIKLFCIDTGKVLRERILLGKSAVFFSGTLTPLSYYRSVLGGDRSSAILTLPSPFVKEQLGVYVMDKISTRYSEREDTLSGVCRAIAAALSAKRGNYMIFSPSFAYSEALYNLFSKKYPKLTTMLQRSNMTEADKQKFIAEFSKDNKGYLIAFCVMGGVFSEGIDLSGDKLIGAVIVGIGMPTLSFEREAIAAYYDELLDEGKQYAYIYPGMNRVFQAAGRVIRSESDRGIVVLIDDRFDDPIYKKTAPTLFSDMKFIPDAIDLKREVELFWKDGET